MLENEAARTERRTLVSFSGGSTTFSAVHVTCQRATDHTSDNVVLSDTLFEEKFDGANLHFENPSE